MNNARLPISTSPSNSAWFPWTRGALRPGIRFAALGLLAMGAFAAASAQVPSTPSSDPPEQETIQRSLTSPDSETEAVPRSLEEPSPSEAFTRTDALLAALTIFTLAVFVGFELITKVPPTLHTPLMSGSNAISGITLVGAILMAGGSGWAALFGMVAVALATINVVGGFMVTDRMLGMFRR